MSWRRDFDRLASRVDQMDQGGTRGVGILQAQVADVVRGLAEMKADSRTWQESHDKQHDDEAKERTASKRWMITTAIAAIATFIAALGILLDVAAHLH